MSAHLPPPHLPPAAAVADTTPSAAPALAIVKSLAVDAWLAQLVEPVTLDLGVMSLSPVLGEELSVWPSARVQGRPSPWLQLDVPAPPPLPGCTLPCAGSHGVGLVPWSIYWPWPCPPPPDKAQFLSASSQNCSFCLSVALGLGVDPQEETLSLGAVGQWHGVCPTPSTGFVYST